MALAHRELYRRSGRRVAGDLCHNRRCSGLGGRPPSRHRCRAAPTRSNVETPDLPPPSTMSRAVTAAKIIVVDNQIEPALKALKKQMLKDGLFQEMKRRAHYEKPSVKRKRKAAQARRRRRRALKRLS